MNKETTIEALTPDFLKKGDAYKEVVITNPDVFNHNIETVPSLYLKVRPGSRYFASLELLKSAKKINNKIFTKSGIMLGLGETKNEIIETLTDLRNVNVDIVTLGQYLQPTKNHLEVKEFISPEQFKEYEIIGKNLGFRHVESGPLVRSSYKAHKHIA